MPQKRPRFGLDRSPKPPRVVAGHHMGTIGMRFLQTVGKRFAGTDFLSSEDGAVTVDWVALTAAIVFLGVGIGFTVSSSVPQLASKISQTVQSMSVMPD